MKTNAVSVLIDNVGDVARAHEFAEKVNNNEIWSLLGNAHLNKYEDVPAIECYMKSKDFN